MADVNTAAKASEDRVAALEGMLLIAADFVREEPSEARLRELDACTLFEEAPEGFDDKALLHGFDLFHEGIADACAEQDGDAMAALQREWLRLFAGVGQPQVPSWANFYLDMESRVLGRETLAVRNLYAKYGVQIEGKGSEPDDDLGLMLRFAAHLVKLEAEGQDTQVDQETLLREHVLPWICAWRYAGLKHAVSAYYRGIVEFTFGLIRTYAVDLGFSYKEDTRSFTVKG